MKERYHFNKSMDGFTVHVYQRYSSHSPMDRITDTTDGRKSPVMVGRADICPLIQSMVVVTSPGGGRE